MRAPFVPQSQEADCGPACLSSVLAAHGRLVPLGELVAASGTGRDGTSAAGLLRAAAEQGLDARAHRLIGDSGILVTRLPLPMIALRADHHFVVVDRVTKRSVSVIDPASGRSLLPRDKFVDSCSGLFLCFTPGSAFRRGGRAPAGAFGRLWRMLAPGQRVIVALAILASAVAAATVLGMAVLLRAGGTLEWPRDALVGCLFASAAAAALAGWWGAATVTAISDRTVRPAARELVSRLIRVTPEFARARFLGEVATRPQRLDSAVESSAALAVRAVTAVLTAVISLAALTVIAPRAGLVALLVAVAVSLLGRWRGVGAAALARAVSSAEAARDGELMHSLCALDVLRTEAAPEALLRRWQNEQERCDALGERLGRRLMLGDRAHQAVSGLGVSLVTVVAWLDTADSFAVAVIPLLAGVVLAGVTAVLEVVPSAATLRQAWGVIDDVPPITQRVEQRDDALAPGALRCTRAVSALGAIAIDLDVEPGEHLVITGRSGVGKSTLLRMLAGVDVPAAGGVARGPGLVGYVPQRPLFLDGTVRDALAFGRELDDDALAVTLRLVELDEVVRSRGGLDATVVHGGANFSGGERQRLALARALAGAAPVLLLDEALSAVEDGLAARILARLRDRTVVSVAHRVTDVPEARLLVLDGEGLHEAAGRSGAARVDAR